ncbi:hypothetical protein [Brevibacterium aurantiacum]|nr:hypothetical protein [Brevibacterium aurantiacum]
MTLLPVSRVTSATVIRVAGERSTQVTGKTQPRTPTEVSGGM